MGKLVVFEDGAKVIVPDEAIVVGLDVDGDLVADHELGTFRLYLLTDCCHASGKGAIDEDTGHPYVCCRFCHGEVDAKFGASLGASDVAVRAVWCEKGGA